jgi:hypothetical protein
MTRLMTRAERLTGAVPPIARPYSVPAPFGGWNTRDALDEMPATDAITLDN